MTETKDLPRSRPLVDRKASAWTKNRRTDKIAEKLARQIVDDVIARELPPGTMLPAETEMLKTYEVGRSTLREALRLLEVQGLLAMKPGPGGGPMLMPMGVDDFARNAVVHLRMRGTSYREVLEARLAVEPLMARMAAEAQDPEGLEALREALRLADDADSTDEDELQYVSDVFHATIANMSGNSMLDLLGMFLREIYIAKPRAPVTPSSMRTHVRSVHRKIAEAIFAGDGAQAETLMRDHMAEYARRSDRRHSETLDSAVNWN